MALLFWWCRLTMRLLCPKSATRLAGAAQSESYHELPRDAAVEELAGRGGGERQPQPEPEPEPEAPRYRASA